MKHQSKQNEALNEGSEGSEGQEEFISIQSIQALKVGAKNAIDEGCMAFKDPPIIIIGR